MRMKRINGQFNPNGARIFAAGVLLATLTLFSGPGFTAQAPGAAGIETRIQEMHGKLAITAVQEDQWKQVAQVMRDNDSALEPLVAERKTNAATMTAIDDLKSYAAITDAHLQGIQKFTTAFATLYSAMSEAQQKDADALFRKGPPQVSKAK
jgi:hypothetical protein